MKVARRTVLTGVGVAAGAAALFPLAMLAGRDRRRPSPGRYGPLIEDPAGILDLPQGFHYRVVERTGDPMSDEFVVPGRLDGMACFDGPDDTLILMRNSEQTDIDGATSPYPTGQQPATQAYDPDSLGGVTRTVVRRDTLERVSSNLVLVGTERNCAGGPSPWGWLSCEESVLARTPRLRHGYVFLCPTDAAQLRAPERIVGYGRFNHEAVAIEPRHQIAYLTEDQTGCSFYRFVPNDSQRPFEGRLQALAIADEDHADTSNTTAPTFPKGVPRLCRWIDVDDPDPPQDTIRHEVQRAGAASFNRTEGLWTYDGQIYVASTSGGPAGLGQLFRYVPGESPEDGGTIELLVESTRTSMLDHPDNVTVAPWGDVFLAEDDYSIDRDHVKIVTPAGEVFDFARNALSHGELAGPCFSPDGTVLFVNNYTPGTTLAISGPFV